MQDRCPTCHRKHKRSNAANSRYWLCLHRMAEKLKPGGVQYSPESYHVYYKFKFLGGEDVKLPNGKVLTIPKSTADLDTGEFHEYAMQVEQDMNERGVFLDELAA